MQRVLSNLVETLAGADIGKGTQKQGLCGDSPILCVAGQCLVTKRVVLEKCQIALEYLVRCHASTHLESSLFSFFFL